jgi:hypothetical protein
MKITIPSVIIITLLILVTYSIINYWNLPEAHFNDLGCVRVIKQGIEHSCENIPNKYIHVWVK